MCYIFSFYAVDMEPLLRSASQKRTCNHHAQWKENWNNETDMAFTAKTLLLFLFLS